VAALDRSHLRGEPLGCREQEQRRGSKGNPATYGKATADIFERVIEMPTNTYVVLYILILIAVIVSVDLLFFKNQFWERLMVNIGIVLVFAAFYLRFLKNP
jgi:type IV secretory pathway VirB2 component (pilin)